MTRVTFGPILPDTTKAQAMIESATFTAETLPVLVYSLDGEPTYFVDVPNVGLIEYTPDNAVVIQKIAAVFA